MPAKGCHAARLPQELPSGDDFHNFQPVAGLQVASGELGRGDGFAIVFYDDTSGQQLLGDEELLERARESALNFLAIGDDVGRIHRQKTRFARYSDKTMPNATRGRFSQKKGRPSLVWRLRICWRNSFSALPIWGKWGVHPILALGDLLPLLNGVRALLRQIQRFCWLFLSFTYDPAELYSMRLGPMWRNWQTR
jgi:hypothetical protein